jgi:hypothetical protein
VINTLLGRISGFFDKEYLFASFLPSLIFLPLIALTFSLVVGIDTVFDWIDAWTAIQKSTASAAASLVVVIFAYILHALRSDFIRFWSGDSSFPFYLLRGFFRLGKCCQERRFNLLRASAREFSPWRDVLDHFEKEVKKKWQPVKNDLPDETRSELLGILSMLHEGMSPDTVKEQLQPVIEAFDKYSGNDLKDIYGEIKTALADFDRKKDMQIKTDTAILDGRFGDIAAIKPTTIGNVIESYNYYAYKRYNIEVEIFWPRLCSVIKPEFMANVREPKIILEFSVTMASLSALYGLGVFIIGPWLWYNPPLIAAGVVFSAFVAALFYRLGVEAACQYGEMVRSSFDLFRLDLMEALGRPRPGTWQEERKQWEELSRLTSYGIGLDFQISKKKGKDE